jgi:hypothetical protein
MAIAITPRNCMSISRSECLRMIGGSTRWPPNPLDFSPMQVEF